MLKTLALHGYRGFKSYRLSDFTRVNLVVGKNNSGKTSILEAIEFLVSDGHISVFYGAARRRDENSSYYRRGYGPGISHLFHGHECDQGAWFGISSDSGERQLRIRVISLDEVGDVTWLKQSFDPEDQQEPAFGLSIVANTKENASVLPMSADGSILDYPRASRRSEYLGDPVQFLSIESFAFAAMGRAWNEMLTDGREDEIIKDMEILLPDIDSIHFLTSDRPSSAGILVGRRGTGRRVPIGSYGDGMRRLLAFRLALVPAANGFLLIDEIDAGLHWTVMEDIWRLLVEMAERSNVQIFATTHSYDCIRGMGALVRTHPEFADRVSIHRVDPSLPQAVSLHGEQIPVAVEQEIEVR